MMKIMLQLGLGVNCNIEIMEDIILLIAIILTFLCQVVWGVGLISKKYEMLYGKVNLIIGGLTILVWIGVLCFEFDLV